MLAFFSLVLIAGLLVAHAALPLRDAHDRHAAFCLNRPQGAARAPVADRMRFDKETDR